MDTTTIQTILEASDILALQPDFQILPIIPRDVASDLELVVFGIVAKKLLIITTNDKSDQIIAFVEKMVQQWYKYEMHYTDSVGMQLCLKRYDQMDAHNIQYQHNEDTRIAAIGLEAEQLIQSMCAHIQDYSDSVFVSEMIRLSYQSGASDLHFQTENKHVTMRIRKDGIMKTLATFDAATFYKYLMKIKFMSGTKMNVDYVPQDGRFDFLVKLNGEEKKIDVRVSLMPWLRWESVVMRFLDGVKSMVPLEELWFSEKNRIIIENNLKKNFGMIIVTGPTGSGKTTTLYSMLSLLNDSSRKIITLEDPVEYEIPGIEQSQINEKKWYTFEKGLKSILRHDPDIILVGEIRSLETAEIAINAAMTGHLVLATLHTNSAIEAISRLSNLWIKPYILWPSINMIIWQRLVRKLTDDTSRVQCDDATLQEMQTAITTINQHVIHYDQVRDTTLHQPNHGNDSYHGRVAVSEVFECDDDFKNMILAGKWSYEITQYAQKMWYLTMKDDAYLKVLEGITTLEEIKRVL